MNTFLILGIIITSGFVGGEISAKIRLPRVTGYLLAGILLNPGVTNFIPKVFNQHTDLITNVALSFITFAVGGVLFYPKIKTLGKTILSITLWEAELAFLAVTIGFIFLMSLTHSLDPIVIIPFALLMGALASPTDPSATLAVKQEYHADGEVSSTIMGVAALDDITGILNYSVSVVLATVLLNHGQLSFQALFLNPLITVIVSILIGVISGLLFNGTHRFFNKETENALIVILIGSLMICYGLAQYFKVDELLATMTMGIIVVNFNPMKEKIFSLLERYTDQLIFVLFFTISGMHLNFQLLWKYLANTFYHEI